MELDFKINGKTILALGMLTLSIAFTTFSVGNNVESKNGIIVEEEQVPIGSIQMWGSSTPPDGWLEMNGQSTSGYPELAKVVGGTLPDLRGEFVRGWDNGRGVDVGRALGSFQLDEFKAHSHSIPTEPDGSGGSGSVATGPHGAVTTKSTNTVGGDETRPRNVALMYIIKAE